MQPGLKTFRLGDEMKNHSRTMIVTLLLSVGITIWVAGLRPSTVAAQSAGLSGSYGFTLTQTWDGGDLPGALMGVLSFDGAGTFTGSATNVQVVSNPTASAPNSQSFPLAGTYTLNADGTGTITAPGNNGPPTTIPFVVTDGGSGLILLATGGFGNHLLSGTARKQ